MLVTKYYNDKLQSQNIDNRIFNILDKEIKVLSKLFGEDEITNYQYGGTIEEKLNIDFIFTLKDFNNIINLEDKIDLNKEYKITIGNQFINKKENDSDYEIINETELYKDLYNEIYKIISQFLKSTRDLEITEDEYNNYINDEIKSIIYNKLLKINIFTYDLNSINLN
jgi:hypothetical protein